MAQNTIFPRINHIPDTRYGYYSERKIGEGYGGVIYEAIDFVTSQLMAVKILNYNSRVKDQIRLVEMLKITQPEFQKDENLQLQETRLVRIFDIIQMNKTFIIMQLCNCNLKQYLSQKSNINQFQVLKIIKNIVEGLLIVEREGYHFSDLKPQNILMTKSGEAVLGDLQSLIKLDSLNSETKQKFRNQIFGTLHYMAPEVVQFGEYGPYNYIWTLGVILHEIIYLQPPFTVIPQISQPTREQKNQQIASFYKNLFNLHIFQNKSKDYPKSQHLLKNMLHLNERKRITLQKLYEFLSKENSNVAQTCRDPSIKFPQKLRSNSQITIDTSFNYQVIKNPSFQSNLKEETILKTCQLFHRNQKQNQCHWFVSETLKSTKRQEQKILEKEVSDHKQQQTSNSQQNALSFSIQIFSETFALIDRIQSPSILVKKLEELKKALIESQHQLQVESKKKEQKCIQYAWCNCKKLIKESRAYSHLQKTAKYSASYKDKQLNSNESNLWEHLNKLLQNREIKIINTQN